MQSGTVRYAGYKSRGHEVSSKGMKNNRRKKKRLEKQKALFLKSKKEREASQREAEWEAEWGHIEKDYSS